MHMNGRIYDPLLGRFLSADPFVQQPWNLQNYNRYSYVLNSPLSNTDSTGYLIETLWDVASASVGVWETGKALVKGDWKGAGIAAAGTALDVAAAAVPGVPGGASVGIRAAKEGSEAAARMAGKEAAQGGAELTTKAASGEAAEAAADKDLEGYLLTLDFPCYFAVMSNAVDAGLRERMHRAFVTRASDQDASGGQWDNTAIMHDILACREQMAHLLGYGNYAEMSVARKMARSVEEVNRFLDELIRHTRPAAERDFAELQAFARERDGVTRLQPWDIAYYSEQLRRSRYDISQDALRVWFPVERVLQGLFEVTERLFGVQVDSADAEAWHPDVRFHEIHRDGKLAARIASYELAARMQLSVPEITDLSSEPAHVLKSYGADDQSNPTRAAFARNCILARRMIESGVRFVQLFNGAYASGGKLNWDGHSKLKEQYDKHAAVLDQPAAALIKDMKRRGLLDDTLVVWCTEFGRMPFFQQGAKGRDHNPDGFTCWLTGAGVKPGVSHGVTDELGQKAVKDIHPLYDFNATILHLLGLDHERLTFEHNGIQRRLTNVEAHVIHEVLA